MENQDPQVGQAIMHPRLNWRHTVVDGDTLWQLAAHYYGDPGDDGRTKTMVGMVAAANHIEDPDQVQVGQVVFPSFD